MKEAAMTMTINDPIKTENSEREDIILNRDKKNIIISAGAGAGKTEMLSKSILTRLISDPSLEPSQVVAITFTNAATEELKTRLYKKYEELEQEAQKNGTDIRKINIDEIFVSTIHSFCSSLITQMSFECGLGISPEFEEKTDMEQDRSVDVFIREYIRRHSEYDALREYNGYSTYKYLRKTFIRLAENHPELELIIESTAAGPGADMKKCLDPLKNNIAGITDMKSSGELAAKLRSAAANGIVSKYDLDAVLEAIRSYYTPKAMELSNRLFRIVESAYKLLEENGIDKDTIKDKQEECIELLGDTLDELKKISDERLPAGLKCMMKNDYGDLLDAAAKLEEVIGQKTGVLVKLKAFAITRIRKPFDENKMDPSSYPYANSSAMKKNYEPTDEDKELFAELGDIFDALNYKDVSSLSKAYEEYFKRLRAEYIKGMYEEFVGTERSTINSNDLLVLTKRLLYGNDPEAVRAYFKSKYKVFYVDEFQDTDYLQLMMILALAGDGNKGLEEGRLFLVGDPKQSIYRFRGAEVEFYNHMKKSVFKPDEFHDLRLNYRSDISVVDWINRTYREKFDGGRISYSDMIPVKKYSDAEAAAEPSVGGDGKAPALPALDLSGDKLQPGVYGEDRALLNADIIADRVVSLLGKIMPVYDKDKKQYCEKTVAPEDIMVITSTKDEATDIYKALKARNIPVTVSGKIVPAEKRAMRRLRALMRYIESGTRLRAAEVAAAFSPLSGLRADGSFSGNGTVMDSYTLEQALRLSDMLASSKSIYYSSGAMAVIYNALNKGYLLDGYMNSMTLNDEMPLLCQFIETLSVECYDNIGAVNEYIADFINEEKKNVLSQSKEVRCVRVMNFHQTKGLEANIVINVDYGNPGRGDSYLFEYYADENGEFKVYPVPKCYMLLSKDKEKQRKKLTAEEDLRKKYVRDTRAEYIMLMMSMSDNPGLTVRMNEAPAVPAAEVPARVFTPMPRDKALEDFDTCYMSASPSRLEKEIDRDDSSAVRKGKRVTLGVENTDDLRKKAGAIRGTVMHRAFELYLLGRRLSERITDERLSCYAKQAVIESMNAIEDTGADKEQTAALVQSVISDVREFRDWFESSPYAGCRTAMETPFSMVLDKNSMRADQEELCGIIEANRKTDMTKSAKSVPADKIFFNGFSDLICIDGEGKFTVIDYKSDEAGYKEKTMLEIYKPQQLAYYLAFGSILKQYSPNSREQLLYAPHAFVDRLTIKGEI